MSDLSQHASYQLIHTLTGMLPPPLADTPEMLASRNQAAIARISALAPVNSDEADIAAHCIAARAQAEEVMRSIRATAGDIPLMIKLNAQFALMERTAVSLRNQLLRLQTARHKREEDKEVADSDAWSRYVAGRQLQLALEQPAPPPAPAAEHPGAEHPGGEPPGATPSAEPLAAMPHAAPPAATQTMPAWSAEPTISAPYAEPPSAMPSAAPPALAPYAVLLAATPTAAPPFAAPTMPPLFAEPTMPARAAPIPPQRAPGTRRHGRRAAERNDDPPRDLPAEADYYAIVYPRRARLIRQVGGLPPDCDFGPPDDDLVLALVTGRSATLRALDHPANATA